VLLNHASQITLLPAKSLFLTSLPMCKRHSTETALLYIQDHLINAIGSQKVSRLCLLDLCHLGQYPPHHSVSMALFSAGSRCTCHLAMSDAIMLSSCHLYVLLWCSPRLPSWSPAGKRTGRKAVIVKLCGWEKADMAHFTSV